LRICLQFVDKRKRRPGGSEFPECRQFVIVSQFHDRVKVKRFIVSGTGKCCTFRRQIVGKSGSRLPLEFILGLIAQGWPEQEITRNYLLTPEQVRACAAYAQERLNEEKDFAVAG
jgi:hypothetical protein